jgi:DNA-binding NtrC family response regulator
MESAEKTLFGEVMSGPLSAARVLVIDDEDPVRSVLAAILMEQGHQVSSASSAEEAFRMLETQDFDVVFTDLAMPKTDGVTAAAGIKSIKPDTKVVLMSGYSADKTHELAADKSYIDAAITKPFRMGEIYNTMRILADRH